MHISVLGPVQIRRNGDEISLGPRLQRLLAALVIKRGHVVSADALAEMVWDGDPPAGAHTTLRSYVTRLRQALDVDTSTIEFRQSGYVLDAAGCDVDADAFETDVEDARLALQFADSSAAETAIERALGRWQGTPFGEIDDETCVRPERVRLEERQTEARELHVEVMLADGRSEQAIASARRLTEEHPLRERPRELLMRAMYIAGRRAEAVRAYREYRELLTDQTGLDPSDELAALEGQILAGELSRQPLAGRARGYELGDVLGRGAFSVVYRATQPGVGRDVAVKIIRAELADQPEFVRHFEHEAQLAAAVEHPHVVPLYDFWREPGAAFLVMRWMRGGDLSTALRERGPLSREQLCRVLGDVGGALHAAHRAGVLHRDVRPANLLRDDDGATYLADFGIAIASAIGLSARPVHYAAPEVLRGEPLDAAADVHSLGVSTFELLTGRLPLSDTTDRVELVRRQLSEALPSVRATRSDLPPLIDDVLARATSKVAGERYATVPEFVDDVARVLGPAGRAPVPGVPGTPAPNPYVGLHAFGEADADRFHGRDQLIGELADALEQHPLVAVVGPSGSGKSSVVRAGLVPAIRSGAVPGSEAWFVTTMVPGADPIGALETALLRVAINPPTSLRQQLAEDGGLLRVVRRVLPDDDSTVLVVVDQFEELFTVVDSDDFRRRFLRELADAISAPGSPLRVVATLRADHYDAPLRDPALAQLVTDGTVTVRPMRADELEAAIVRPASRAGVSVESALVAELIAGVSDRPAALPLLQFSLTELYERRVADAMLLETHQSLGGLSGALAARAERTIERGDDRDRDLIRRMFTRLIAFGEGADGDARRRAPLTEFGDDERTAWLIDELVAARLLVVDRDDETREPTLEVAHEALLRDWPRLASWIDEDRADLRVRRMITAAASEWAGAGADAGMLARGGRLELVSDLADRRPELINAFERAWIDRSSEVAAAEAAKERRQRRVALITAAVVVVVAVIGTAIALVLRDRAADNERVAEARELVLEAEKAVTDDPELGLLLGLEAADAFEDATGNVPTSALQVLRAGIAASRIELRLAGESWAATSADGSMVASGTETGGIVVYDADTGDVIEGWELDEGPVTGGRFAGSELVVTVATADGMHSLRRVDPASGDVGEIAERLDLGRWAEVTVDLGLGVRIRTPGELEVIELTGGEPVRTFATADDTAPKLTDDGLVVFARGDDGAPAIVIADIRTGEETEVSTTFFPLFGAVSPDRGRVVVARQSGDIAAFDIASGDLLWTGPALSRTFVPVWSPDGELVATGGESGLAILDAQDGSIVAALEPHRGITWWYEFVGGRDVVAARSEENGDIAVARVSQSPEIRGGLVELGLHQPGWAMTAPPSGEVIVADGQSVSVVRNGEEQRLYEGVHADGESEFSWTTPRASATGMFSVNDGRSHIYDATSGARVWTAPDEWSVVHISDDGESAVVHRTADGVGATRVVGLRSGTVTDLPDAGTFITATVAPSGRHVNTTDTHTGEMMLYGVDGTELNRVGREASGLHPTFFRDGSTLVVGMLNGDVVGVDFDRFAAGTPIAEAETFRIDAHDTLILTAAPSPDGTLLATVPQNEPARVWDVATGDLIAEFAHDGPNVGIAFHPTEPWVYVVRDQTLTTHTLDTDELMDIARTRVTRGLTEAECQRYLGRRCD